MIELEISTKAVLELLRPQELNLDLQSYLEMLAKSFYTLLKNYIRRGGVAYTLFIPKDVNFIGGEWHSYSPTIFWGINKEEKKQIVKSSLLYYLFWADLPSYTMLWNRELSSYLPFNLQFIKHDELSDTEDFKVIVEDEISLIDIYFSQNVQTTLNNFLKKSFGNINIDAKELDDIFQNQEDYIFYNFRKIEEIAKDSSLSLDANDIKAIERLSQKLNEALNKALSIELKGAGNIGREATEKITILSKVLIKLLLIGPSVVSAMRILNPKQYEIEINGKKRYLGSLAGLLRVYDDNGADKLEKILSALYPLALSILDTSAFRVTTKFMHDFIMRHALQSAVAQISSRVLAHDWSHLLVHADLPNEYKGDWFDHFKKFLRERMVFIADLTTMAPSWAISLPFLSMVLHPFIYPVKKDPSKIPRTPFSNCIVRSEGIDVVNINVCDRENEISVRLGENNIIRYQFLSGKGIWLSNLENGETSRAFDLYVSIPSGIVGNHAFYGFLENFIRNSAKYAPEPSDSKKKNKIIIRIRIDEENFEGSEELYRVRVWDDRGVYDENAFQRICEFFPPQSLRGEFQKKFSSKEQNWRIIDEAGEVIPGGWGIKEMRMCAAWLRFLSPVDVFMNEREFAEGEQVQTIPVLRPIIVINDKGEIQDSIPSHKNGDPNDKLFIGYEFYLLKPKQVLIIDLNHGLPGSHCENLRRLGVDLVSDLNKIKKPRHYMCIVKLPQEGKEKWIDYLKKHRDDLPSVLSIAGKGVSIGIDNVSSIDFDKYEEIFQKLHKNQKLPEDLLKLYKDWLRDVLEAPDKLTLLLHINPHYSQETPQEIFAAWEQTAKNFNELFDIEKKWKMFVVKRGIFGNEENLVVSGKPNYSELQNLYVYDYHREFSEYIYRKLRNKDTPREERKKIEKIENEIKYLEWFRGTNPTHSLFYYPPVNEWDRLKLTLDLITAALTKVLVIDERIKRRIDKDNLLRERVKRANIEVPKGINYAEPTLEDVDNILEILARKQVHILVIHQGILDKIFAREKNVRDSIEEWISKVKKKTKFVVVVSDRGKPENVPRNARFADYAVLDKFISEADFSKFLLTQTLFASKTIK